MAVHSLFHEGETIPPGSEVVLMKKLVPPLLEMGAIKEISKDSASPTEEETTTDETPKEEEGPASE